MTTARISHILRLFRYVNLIVVVITEYLLYYRLIRPALLSEGIEPLYTHLQFAMVIAITLAITISGYLINDLVDTRIDDINRPGTNPVKKLGDDLVVWLYTTAILTGFILSLLLVLQLDEQKMLWIFPVATGILVLYSLRLKRVPLIGNLVVAGYCAAVLTIPLVAERRQLAALFDRNEALARHILMICLLFMTFAFLATLMREIIKDIEDRDGDEAEGRRTLPVAFGVTTSRYFALGIGAVLGVVLLLPLFAGWEAFFQQPMLVVIALLVGLLLWIQLKIYRAKRKHDFRRISMLLKVLMLVGLSMLVLY